MKFDIKKLSPKHIFNFIIGRRRKKDYSFIVVGNTLKLIISYEYNKYSTGMKVKYVYNLESKVVFGTIERIHEDSFYDIIHIWLKIDEVRPITPNDLLVEVKTVETNHD